MQPIPLEQAPNWIGKDLGHSDWLTIDEHHLSLFSQATYLTPFDVDLTMSRNHPLGSNLVDGFLLLSLLTHFHFQAFPIRHDKAWGFNYGLDRVRFTQPVMLGQRIRCHFKLLDVRPKGEGVLLTVEDTLKLEGSEKPAMVAVWLSLMMTR